MTKMTSSIEERTNFLEEEDKKVHNLSEPKREKIWEEHLPAHWGADKVFWQLKRKGISIPLELSIKNFGSAKFVHVSES